ncbi:MAG: TSUP family transporter [Reyranella sp.]|uniref:TSUP family transporter n=1 Tax=Reyranella sp. TaxID=1929291 RepID=UPI00272F46F2|nr:TSUP family transporter [Reyranella sp.]MDP1962601.1 TSUP family transporter [Reyranella sp.]MDP2375779.1 TSUP family transporter [Reyranella sp.]
MNLIIIGTTALLASGLTLFSGFGLGTVLMPVFALFFPVPVAIAATAVVHLANNLFKIVLVGRRADWGVVLRFGIPAAAAAMVGASTLFLFAELPVLATYELGGRKHEITVLKVVIGALIIMFAGLDLSPRFAKLSFPPRYLLVGGLLSGFFGGLSGNQGAFRSAFLIRAGLDKEAFVGTGVVSTVIVDTVRLIVYGVSFYTSSFVALGADVVDSVAVAIASAFVGAYAGTRLLEKVTLRFVQLIVAVAMVAFGVALGGGII